ncbi:DNA-directed DNA polymerase eta rad30, partial [Mortierella sp. GBA30]
PGDSKPDYYPSPSRYTHKVSLDPYRKASARIFNVFRKFCPKHQKGGLDEIFMDITDIVNQKIVEEYGADLSKWDRESAVMVDWKKDHPNAGVVYGMPRDGAAGVSSNTLDEDEDEDDEEDGGPQLDGIKNEEEEQEVDSDGENENTADTKADNMVSEEDDFDLDLEQFLDSDFDEISISQSHMNIEPNSTDHSTSGNARTIPAPCHPGPSIVNTHNPQVATVNDEKSEEELRKEEEDKAERLRIEKEQLLPYYGVPEGTFEEEFWAEMQLLKAAEYCNTVRQAVKDELGYTCSAGVANNKLLAKLGSGMNKPFQQTIILPKYVPDLLHGLKLSKIRNLGGKFGRQVKQDYNIERASQLWPIPLRKLQERYGEQAGLELWQWCRGIDHVGIRKAKSKSMCSHKSFIPALSDLEEIQFWISSICLELVSRMTAEYEETERWPRTISLGFYGGVGAYQDQQQQERRSTFRPPHKGSRSMPFGSRFEYGGVEGMARKMYTVIEKLIKEAETGRGRPILPLVILTVTVSNFSGGHGSAMGDITKFFSKAPIKKNSMEPSISNTEPKSEASEGGSERARLDQEGSTSVAHPIHQQSKQDTSRKDLSSPEPLEMQARRRFFERRTTSRLNEDLLPESSRHPDLDPGHDAALSSPLMSADCTRSSPQHEQRQVQATLLCEQCPSPGQHVAMEEWEQHMDYHFALSLLEDDRKQQQMERQQQQASNSINHPSGPGGGTKRSVSSGSNASSSTRGKRKKASSSGASAHASESSSPSIIPLSKFFKPNT